MRGPQIPGKVAIVTEELDPHILRSDDLLVIVLQAPMLRNVTDRMKHRGAQLSCEAGGHGIGWSRQVAWRAFAAFGE
jgi:hypothetical protein